MTPLAANANRPYEYVDLEDLGYGLVNGGSHLYKGGLWQWDSAGYLIPLSTDPNLAFAGLGIEEADGTLISDGDLCTLPAGLNGGMPRFARKWLARFAKSGTVAQTDVGDKISAIDDNTVARALGVYTSPTSVANSAFTLTGKLPGVRVGFALTEDGASQTLEVAVLGVYPNYTIRVRAKTSAGSVQDSLASEIKTAIEANVLANSLVTFAYQAGHSGAGKPAAIAETELTLPGPIVGTVDRIDGSYVWVRSLI